MKQTKTKSVDARRLAETEMDDDADVKSFIFFLSLSFLLIFARAHAHAQNAPVVPLCFRGRVCVRDVCLSLSLCRVNVRDITQTRNSLGFTKSAYKP